MTDNVAADSLSDPLSWRPLKAPSLLEFQVIATEAYRRLPAHFRARCEGVVVHVEDTATDEVLDAMGIAVPVRKRAGADAQHGLALPRADPALLGRAR